MKKINTLIRVCVAVLGLCVGHNSIHAAVDAVDPYTLEKVNNQVNELRKFYSNMGKEANDQLSLEEVQKISRLYVPIHQTITETPYKSDPLENADQLFNVFLSKSTSNKQQDFIDAINRFILAQKTIIDDNSAAYPIKYRIVIGGLILQENIEGIAPQLQPLYDTAVGIYDWTRRKLSPLSPLANIAQAGWGATKTIASTAFSSTKPLEEKIQKKKDELANARATGTGDVEAIENEIKALEFKISRLARWSSKAAVAAGALAAYKTGALGAAGSGLYNVGSYGLSSVVGTGK